MMQTYPLIPGACVVLMLLAAFGVRAQERFALYVPSDPVNVERMLKLAGLKDDDVVVDLGSGDGRIVLTAARMNPKLTGWGVDVDEKLVNESNMAAQKQGVAHRVKFFHRNAFDADISNVTVIAMWLWPEIMRMLRPKILAEARPGTRVLTNLWDMGSSWKADQMDSDGMPVHMWIVPAPVGGYWNWDLPLSGANRSYAAMLEQQFQHTEGVVRVGNRRGLLENMRVNGGDIVFQLDMTIDGSGFTKHLFSGKVNGDVIVGTVRIVLSKKRPNDKEEIIELPWRATREKTSAYFAPTGLGPR